MALRKEQVLLLAVLALGLLQYRSIGGDAPPPAVWQPGKKDYVAVSVPVAALAETGAPVKAGRDLFREPSETQALPPRPLPLPEQAPLSLVALPLEVGPDLGHAHLLQMDGTPVAGVTLQPGGETAEPAAGTAGNGVGDGTGNAEGQGASWERWARTYDMIWVQNQSVPFLGIIEAKDKHALEATTDFSNIAVRYRRFYPSQEKLRGIETTKEGEVTRIELARTLRNEVERQKRRVPEHAGNLADRARLIDWLLQQAQTEAWVYDEALAQADIYLRLSGDDLEGFRLKVRVLRQKGDLAGEFALYGAMSEGRLAESAFRYQGLGSVKAILGLDAAAERDLRHAVELAPGDPRPLAALAGFLLSRGRAGAARAVAEQGTGALGMITNPGERALVVGAIVACQLAVGDVAAARQQLAQEGDPTVQAALTVANGSVLYAAGQPQEALDAFRRAAAAAGGAEAVLASAACLLRLGQWQDAQAAFESTAVQSPLLRGRAWAGLGLLFLRTGQRDVALQFLDRSLEADPLDAYAHYLRARVLRELGQPNQAIEALQAALRLRDDFQHALAEVALCHWAIAADGRSRDAAVHLLDAVRYADRTVDLAGDSASREFLELQATLRLHAGDFAAAEAAFARARDAAAQDQERFFARAGIALCDYARNRVDEARDQLQRLATDAPLDHPMRRYAEATMALIDDHSQKERLEDRFERSELGAIWPAERDGALGPAVVDNHLEFRGRASRAGEVWAERKDALPKGGRFLSVQVKLQLLPGHARDGGFAGLRLENAARQGQAAPDFRVQFGLQDGRPWLRIEDGRSAQPGKEQEREPVRGFESGIPDFDPNGVHALELRVVPRDEQGRMFRLLCRWNGVLVHERDLTSLRADSSNELRTVLLVGSGRGADVAVRFDDYVLERRKEN